MRLFIAINLSPETKDKLIALTGELRAASPRGNFSLPENLHLTLAFLGECSENQASRAKSAMDALDFQPFDLRVERIGRFPREGGDIWWAGVSQSGPLMALHRDLTEHLLRADFSLERRPYRPHITLGRKVSASLPPRPVTPFAQRVTSIELMKSEQIAGKLTYTAIYAKTLPPPPTSFV